MKKKLLEAIPIPTNKRSRTQKKYSLNAYTQTVEGEGILIIDCYYSMNDELTYRMFITKNDYITLDGGQEGAKRWKVGGIENVLGYGPYGQGVKVKAGDKKSEKTIIDFVKTAGTKASGDVAQHIYRHQKEIREQRLIKRYRKITDPIDRRMEQVPQLPEDFDTFLSEEALYKSRYLFYEYRDRKWKKAWCSWCKTWVMVKDTGHDKKGICPHCNSEVTMKAMKKQKYIYDNVTVEIMQRIGDEILIRKFRVERKYRFQENINNPFSAKDGRYERERVFYSLDGMEKDTYNWEMFKQREIRWVKSDNRYYQETVVLYSNNLNEVFSDTRYQYSGIKLLAESHRGFEFKASAFINAYPSEKYFEYLIKFKLCNILKDLLSIGNYHSSYSSFYKFKLEGNEKSINTKATDIAGLLKIQKYDLQLLQAADANLTGLKYLQHCRTNGIKPAKDTMIFVQERYKDNLGELLQFTKYATLYKCIKYLESVKRVGKLQRRIEMWNDYLQMCKQLKYDMKNDFVIFPRDLKFRHDQCIDLINDLKNEEKNKENREIEKMHKALVEEFSFENDILSIVVPRKASDIIREGQKLHHCVGSYVSRVNKKETIILFIRKKDSLDTPFYTMEIKNNDVAQVRGTCNASMTPEVRGFIESFKAKVLKRKKKGAALIA